MRYPDVRRFTFESWPLAATRAFKVVNSHQLTSVIELWPLLRESDATPELAHFPSPSGALVCSSLIESSNRELSPQWRGLQITSKGTSDIRQLCPNLFVCIT